MKIFKKPLEFHWNKGNIGKNIKHKVEDKEAEEPFFDKKRKIYKDELHSIEHEERYIIVGKTKKERFLYTVFTMRGKKIKIISSRSINKKEVVMYEKKA